jgi:hypothetical protein
MKQENDQLSREAFYGSLREELLVRCPVGMEIFFQTITKNNDVRLHGCLLRRNESHIAPTLYMENFYDLYKDGMSVGETADAMLKICVNSLDDVREFEFAPEDWESVRKMIGMKVLGYERNPELLQRVPYIRYEDLAVVFIFVLKEAGITGGVAVITSELSGLWGISAEELFAQARQSAPVLLEPVVSNIRNMIGDCPEEVEEIIDDPENAVDMYILTNKSQTYGASALFYPGLLEKITDYLGGGFYILPSSVHEVILIPEAAGEPDALRRMVQEVNRCEVPEDMILSDNVYYYDPEEKQFRIV